MLKYDKNSPAKNRGALAGLEAGTGLCEEFASLFVALARASGIPARVVNGFATDKSLLLKNTGSSITGFRHQWAEFYIAGLGWLPADPTLHSNNKNLFATLPLGHYIAQNYTDLPVRASFQGGSLKISYADTVK